MKNVEKKTAEKFSQLCSSFSAISAAGCCRPLCWTIGASATAPLFWCFTFRFQDYRLQITDYSSTEKTKSCMHETFYPFYQKIEFWIKMIISFHRAYRNSVDDLFNWKFDFTLVRFLTSIKKIGRISSVPSSISANCRLFLHASLFVSFGLRIFE